MKRMKWLSLLLTLGLVMSLIAGCASNSGDSAQGERAGEEEAQADEGDSAPAEAGEETKKDPSEYKIGVILPSGRGDISIGDAVYNAVAAASERCGCQFDYAECLNATDPENFIREFADSGEYDLIVGATFTCFDGISIVSKEYPDQKFLGWDMAPWDSQNVSFGGFNHHETMFVAGAFAAIMDPYGEVVINGETYHWEPNGKIAAIVANNNAIEDAIQAGYLCGAKYINPDIQYDVAYVGSYSDQPKTKELGLSFYDEGYNWLVMGAGGGSIGQVEAAEELGDGRWCIAHDQDNNGVSVHVIASALNETSEAMADWIVDFVENGVFEPGECRLFGYTTGNQRLALQPGIEVPPEAQEKLDKVIENISNGTVVAPKTLEEIDGFTDTLE